MSRVVILSAIWNFRRGDVVELSASQVTALGSAARAVTGTAGSAAPTRDQLGESFAASNSSP